MLWLGHVVPCRVMEIIAEGKLLFITEAAACRWCLQPGAQLLPVETLNAIKEHPYHPSTPGRARGKRQG